MYYDTIYAYETQYNHLKIRDFPIYLFIMSFQKKSGYKNLKSNFNNHLY